MKLKNILLFSFAFVFSLLSGTEYFVSVKGSDQNNGLSEKTPFRTINKAAKKIVPGDTVTILPGEYHEEVLLRFPGDPKRPTTFRAGISGTVHMRGDVPAPAFKAVPGIPGIYMCKVNKLPEYVLERDTVQKYKKVPSLSEVETTPGSTFFDAENKIIYLHTSDSRAPENHSISFSMLRGDGLRFTGTSVKNVHVKGIIFSGYNSATSNGTYKSTFGGVYMRAPVNCSVKECIVYLCGSGVTFNRFADSLIEECIFFANNTEFNGSGGNLLCYGPGKTTVQRNVITFASAMAGQRFYGSPFDRCLIENCFSFDNKYGDIWIKYASDTAWVKGSYASSLIRSRLIENCIFTTGDTYYHGRAKNSICREREPRFDPRKEFADPDHLDFRLLKNSRFRKGGERGIKGYDPKVIFDDDSKLISGGTLYLTLPRRKPLILKNLKNIIIRGRGTMPALLRGELKFENCKNVRLENVNCMEKVTFINTDGVFVKRCAFLKDTVLPAKTRVRHNLFAASLRGADGGFLRGNIFCSSYSGKPEFSGWNAYVKGPVPAFEISSWKSPAPIFNNLSAGDLTLKNHSLFAGKTADGFPTGQYRYDTVFITDGMQVSPGAVSAESATFLIRTAAGSQSTVKVTATDGKTITKTEKGRGEYSLSFTGLRPGAAYKAYCDVTPLSEKRLTNAPKSSSAPRRYVFEFTTARKDTPKTLHVSPSGSNLNDGSTPAKAMAGINAAIKRAAPGDTILIHSGVYREALKVHATGSPGKVLTITGAPGAEVIIDGDGSLLRGVEIRGREFVKIDNLNFIRLAGSGAVSDAAAVVVRDSSDICISRIFHDNRSGSSQRSFVGSNTKNMLIENCVAITPFGGYEFYKCPDLEIRHSVFFRGKTLNGRIMTSMTAPAKVHHCIFVGQEIQKVKNPTFGASEIAAFTEHDNGFFVRVPRAEKPIIGFNSRNGKILPRNDGGDILNKEWVRQGRFYNQILTYDLFCKELNRKATALFSDPQMKALPFYHKFESLQQWYDQFVLGKGGKEVKNKFRTARQKELRQDEKLRITDFIATAPEYRKRNIGLDPAAFEKR